MRKVKSAMKFKKTILTLTACLLFLGGYAQEKEPKKKEVVSVLKDQLDKKDEQIEMLIKSKGEIYKETTRHELKIDVLPVFFPKASAINIEYEYYLKGFANSIGTRLNLIAHAYYGSYEDGDEDRGINVSLAGFYRIYLDKEYRGHKGLFADGGLIMGQATKNYFFLDENKDKQLLIGVEATSGWKYTYKNKYVLQVQTSLTKFFGVKDEFFLDSVLLGANVYFGYRF